MSKVVLLLGAGATVSDVATRAQTSRPPLDKHFFGLSSRAGYQPQVARVHTYMSTTYAVDIRGADHDSLEQVMGQLYTDLFNPRLESRAAAAFRALIQLFNERLATTTNNIAATQKRYLYRILTHYLSSGIPPEDLTIVTFNQDLQAEKILQLLASKRKWSSCADQLFNFPHLYGLVVPLDRVTAPTGGGESLFPASAARDDCLRVFKLHGSLNWYSTHVNRTPSATAMFRQNRRLNITRRRDIYVNMSVSGPSRTQPTLPMVIPPVSHKSAVLHNSLKPIWAEAERRLTEATDVIVFGYSCPALDFESLNMLRRSSLAAKQRKTISLIDPDGATATRYANLLQPGKLIYYASADEFLLDHH